MFRSTVSEFQVPPFVKDLPPSAPEGTIGDAKFLPSVELFERFGICGNCIVACRRGGVALMDLRDTDEILTRSHGWVSTVCMMVHSTKEEIGKVPLATFVGEGCLGSGLPQGDLALGINNLITRYVMPPAARRPSSVSLQLSSREHEAVLRNCSVNSLCVPVFRERLEVLVQGIYVMCPALADVAMKPDA